MVKLSDIGQRLVPAGLDRSISYQAVLLLRFNFRGVQRFIGHLPLNESPVLQYLRNGYFKWDHLTRLIKRSINKLDQTIDSEVVHSIFIFLRDVNNMFSSSWENVCFLGMQTEMCLCFLFGFCLQIKKGHIPFPIYSIVVPLIDFTLKISSSNLLHYIYLFSFRTSFAQQHSYYLSCIIDVWFRKHNVGGQNPIRSRLMPTHNFKRNKKKLYIITLLNRNMWHFEPLFEHVNTCYECHYISSNSHNPHRRRVFNFEHLTEGTLLKDGWG